MNLHEKLESEARSSGADYFGVADLSLTRGGAVTPGEAALISEYPLAIAIGVALNSSIVDRIRDQSDIPALLNYRFHTHEVVNPLLDQITRRISAMIAAAKHVALPIPASHLVDAENMRGVFSNKMAASLSGLGWIGKSCLLITPRHGPRVRWGTILTDAPLRPGSPIEERCGNCARCVDTCPARAFTGRPFVASEPREARMDVDKHNDLKHRREQTVGTGICGMCVYICPYGRAGHEM